jgi:hypothetical protein
VLACARVFVCACLFGCVRVCVCVCVCVFVCVCVMFLRMCREFAVSTPLSHPSHPLLSVVALVVVVVVVAAAAARVRVLLARVLARLAAAGMFPGFGGSRVC